MPTSDIFVVGGFDLSAIRAAYALAAGGGTVYWPGGAYQLDGTVSIPSHTRTMLSPTAMVAATTSAGAFVIYSAQDVTFEGGTVKGDANGVFRIGSDSVNITLRGIRFEDVTQSILLFQATCVTIESCNFFRVTYGVIQQANFSSSHVRVRGCTASEMTGDFVEANCTHTARSSDWIIEGNQFLGSKTWPIPSTENRFVGLTSVRNITIANNYVERSAGDSAVHIEDGGGQLVIANNHFKNCVGARPYLYLIGSDADTIISNNYYVHDDSSLPGTHILFTGDGAWSNAIQFCNNRVIGNSSLTLNGIDIGYHRSIIINANTFSQCNKAIYVKASKNIIITSNLFDDCGSGITHDSNGPVNYVEDNNLMSV